MRETFDFLKLKKSEPPYLILENHAMPLKRIEKFHLQQSQNSFTVSLPQPAPHLPPPATPRSSIAVRKFRAPFVLIGDLPLKGEKELCENWSLGDDLASTVTLFFSYSPAK